MNTHKIEVRKPDEKFWEFLCIEVNEQLTHGCKATCTRETRTSYRIGFELPHYTETGMMDGYSNHELILHKDRPILEYTVVNKQPDYLARKHKVQTWIYDDLYDAFVRAADKAYGYSQLDELQDKAEAHKRNWHKDK